MTHISLTVSNTKSLRISLKVDRKGGGFFVSSLPLRQLSGGRAKNLSSRYAPAVAARGLGGADGRAKRPLFLAYRL